MKNSFPKWRVLVVPAGTEIGLEIARSLLPCKEVELFGAGRLECSPGPFKYPQMFSAPMVNEIGFEEAILSIILENNISHVFAAHDDVLIKLSEIGGKLGAKLVTSSPETCRVARSKRKTLQLLRDVLPAPAIYESADAVHSYPVFVKPEAGQGSRGARIVHSKEQLVSALADDPTLLIQENLSGDEFTIDCFSDRDRGLLYAAGRVRARVTSGIAAHACFVEDDKFLEYAKFINDALPFHGAWFFQLKRDSLGELRLLEVAARVAGTSGLSRVSGVNLPLLSIYEAERIEVTIPKPLLGVTLDRAQVPFYRHRLKYDAVYVDFDDALVIHGRLNTILLRVLYQCVNKSIPVILVSRHKGDLMEALRRHRILGLFDKIVHLQNGESKATAIMHRNAFFIDDSYRELSDLEKRNGIIGIHPSAVELILEDYD